jgi:predicted nuclease with TOPRIM domain
MKDIKNWIIFILLGLTLIFGYITLTEDDSDYKRKVEILKEDNTRLLNENSKIDRRIDSLNLEYINLQKKDSLLAIEISKRDVQIANALASSKKSREELERIKAGLIETRKKIDSLKANPIKRTGDDLLNSLKLKTQ